MCPTPPVSDREPAFDKGGDTSKPRIRCPLCSWSPRKDDQWSCTCGYSWNTFDTGEVCPSCLHSGRRPSAFLVCDGQLILFGMQNECSRALEDRSAHRKRSSLQHADRRTREWRLMMKSLVYILTSGCRLSIDLSTNAQQSSCTGDQQRAAATIVFTQSIENVMTRLFSGA